MKPAASSFLIALAATGLPAQTATRETATALNQFSSAVQALTSRVSLSVVRIVATRYAAPEESGRTNFVAGKEQSIGSGAIVDPDGYILTNAHVVSGAQKIKVDLVEAGEQTIPGILARSYAVPQEATLVGVFKEGDIALIKIARKGLPALPFADYSKLQQGQIVFALGSPAGLQNSVSMGIVSSIARQPDPDSPFLYIQTDTPINPGNSGGPLVNTAGELVGLNTFILTQSGGSEGVGFAIPSMLLKWVFADLRKYGHAHRSTLGVGLQTINPVLAAALKLPQDSGVLISDVVAGGPAEAAGVKLNDVLVAVDGRPVDSVPSMLGFFFEHGGGEHVKFEVLRGHEKLTLDVLSIDQPHDADHLVDFADSAKDVLPALGILCATVDKRVAPMIGDLRITTGVVVAARIQNSPAIEAGLQVGDVIHSINDQFVFSVDELKTALAVHKSGDAVALLVERRGQLVYVAFELQ